MTQNLPCALLISGSQLQICPSGLTCCTEQMEQKLWSVSKDQYGKRIQSETGSIQRLFNKRGKKFDGKLEKLLTDVSKFVSGQNFSLPQINQLVTCLVTASHIANGKGGKNCRFDG